MKSMRHFLLFLLIIPVLTAIPQSVNYREDPAKTSNPDSVINGYGLPFREDWSSGNFEYLQWTPSSSNWVISDEVGNPAPAAEFSGDPVQYNYEMGLESYPFNLLGMMADEIWLDYDVKLDCHQPTGDEKLRVQIWNWSQNLWTTIDIFKNDNGSFDWKKRHYNIKAFAQDKVFKIRFLAAGATSADIQSWFIDNIKMYCSCPGPEWIELEEHEDFNLVNWDDPGNWIYNRIHWDDSINSGNSIGTGSATEFEVAARWTPEQLLEFSSSSIYEIGFFPMEPDAAYRVRIWTGSGPDTMIFDQAVSDPDTNKWNYVTLPQPLDIDTSKDLWVGYYINTPYGYPAGVDEGPAIDGFGNMINFGGWQTLININPYLDFNWNINCLLGANPYNQNLYFNLYRSTNQGEFQLLDKVYQLEYYDNSVVLSDHYCYQVSQIKINGIDTCESNLADTVCETVNVGIEQPEPDKTIQIYPNPASNWLNIESEEEIRSVRIYNLLGKEMLKMEIGNSEAQIDVSSLESGIYYVSITTVCREFKEKILIIR